MATKMTRKLRNEIATLSTGGVGTYYDSPGKFFSRLWGVLGNHDLENENTREMEDENPPIHTSEGRGRVTVVNRGMDTPLFDVWYTWYRMPSGRWEFVCGPTC